MPRINKFTKKYTSYKNKNAPFIYYCCFFHSFLSINPLKEEIADSLDINELNNVNLCSN